MELFIEFLTAAKGTAHLILLGLIISLTRQRGGFLLSANQTKPAGFYERYFLCLKRIVACAVTDITGSVIERQL